MLTAHKDTISPVESFERLTAGYGIAAIFLDLGNGNLLPQKWFGLSWLLDPPQLANTALAPTPEPISCFTPGYLRSSGDGLLYRLAASCKG